MNCGLTRNSDYKRVDCLTQWEPQTRINNGQSFEEEYTNTGERIFQEEQLTKNML